MISYAFEHLVLERVVAVTKPENQRSIRVLEKMNFRYEKAVSGLSKEFEGAEGDLYYSLFRDEFKK